MCSCPCSVIHQRTIVVPAPENLSVARTFKIAVLTVPQVMLASKVQRRRGHTVQSNVELSRSIFLRENFIKNVDAILVVGTFDLEPCPCSPKVLCLRFSALQSSISNKDATTLLSIIGSSSGKHGFELSRTCGSSGQTCAQSDRDLLVALHDCRTSLPRKAGASKISRFNQFCYMLTYRRVAAPPRMTALCPSSIRSRAVGARSRCSPA